MSLVLETVVEDILILAVFVSREEMNENSMKMMDQRQKRRKLSSYIYTNA
jgi:hypothetical protein